MNVRRLIVTAMLALSALTIGLAGLRGKEKDDGIEEMMERVHRGKKSPLRQLEKQVDAKAPDWQVASNQVPPFQKMSRLLTGSRRAAIKDASDGYADAVKALATAVGKRDQDGTRKALKLLNASCADCHYQGGPGGRLDD